MFLQQEGQNAPHTFREELSPEWANYRTATMPSALMQKEINIFQQGKTHKNNHSQANCIGIAKHPQ